MFAAIAPALFSSLLRRRLRRAREFPVPQKSPAVIKMRRRCPRAGRVLPINEAPASAGQSRKPESQYGPALSFPPPNGKNDRRTFPNTREDRAPGATFFRRECLCPPALGKAGLLFYGLPRGAARREAGSNRPDNRCGSRTAREHLSSGHRIDAGTASNPGGGHGVQITLAHFTAAAFKIFGWPD